MLKIFPVQSRSQIEQLFERFNAREQCWLVSDLRTKFELQQKILDRDSQFIDESVLRASDLWKILLKRMQPQLRLVSDHFARTILRIIIENNAEVLGVNASASESIYAYIDQLAVIIFHPEGGKRLEEWFQDHPEAKSRWRDWYLRAYYCAIRLLEEHKIITANWITSYLQSFNETERAWKTPLIVDLGGEISRVEAELIRTISRTVDVTIIEPSPAWKEDFKYLLKPYEDMKAQSTSVYKPEPVVAPQKRREILRFSGMLAETKNAVGQVRQWLEQGVAATSIAVVAPDIEAYWPVLHCLLNEEGIATQKDVSHKVQTLPSVIRWLATLRLKNGRLSSSDLEISFFENSESQLLRYEIFKSLFCSLYETEDLSRNEIVEKLFANSFNSGVLISRDEFIITALGYWNSDEGENVQNILREVMQNAVVTTQMTWKDWLSYLETIVAYKEIAVTKGVSEGIIVTKLMSADSPKALYRIFLGLTDEALRSSNKTLLSGQDYFELAKDIGFYLDNPDQSNLDFELRLLAESPSIHDIYCFGATDFSGNLCSPATFWMNEGGVENHECLTLPIETRWDEIQHSESLMSSDFSNSLNQPTRDWTLPRKEKIEKRVSQDMGHYESDPMSLSELPSVSASSIENFLKCPFIFAAQKYFNLKDVPDIDLDVDHRTRGQLAHALFEKLTAPPMRYDWTVEELNLLLDQIRKEKQLQFADERLWLPLQKKHVQLGLRFIKFEQNWRREFTQTKTVGREKSFQFYIDPNTEIISRSPQEGTFRVTGQIDRLDCDDLEQLVIIDYKSSNNGTSAHSSWIKNNKLQLLFYMWIMEKSLVEGIKGEVIGLFYYFYRTFDRKGFKIEDLSGSLYSPSHRKDKNGTLETKERYLVEFSEILMSTLNRIKTGEIAPKPLDTQDCKTCEWRRQCRAPHLN